MGRAHLVTQKRGFASLAPRLRAALAHPCANGHDVIFGLDWPSMGHSHLTRDGFRKSLIAFGKAPLPSACAPQKRGFASLARRVRGALPHPCAACNECDGPSLGRAHLLSQKRGFAPVARRTRGALAHPCAACHDRDGPSWPTRISFRKSVVLLQSRRADARRWHIPVQRVSR
jgi:hypothetical protein